MDGARPAGFWIRTASALAYFGVFFLVQISLGYVGVVTVGPDIDEAPAFLPMVWAFTVLFAGLYTTVLHARAGGQTLGKMLMGVRATGAEGDALSIGTALLRFIGYFASLGILGMGFVMAGLRRDKRALHDLLAGSRVVRVARAPRPPEELAEPPGAGGQ
jgi:uncharacterized RDD family membrane protein YckC